EVHGHRLHAFAALDQPRRPVAARGPQTAAFPARAGVVDAPVQPLDVEAERVRDAQQDHLAVLERHDAVLKVRGRHRHVLAEAERIVLVDPAVIAGLCAIRADAFEAGAGILIEGPAFGAVIAGCFRSIERALALAAIEAADVTARQRYPDYALAVDIAAARAEARHRHVVDFRQR